MSKLDGACLCRAVSYSGDAEPFLVATCHCDNCQRQAGSAFSIIVGVPKVAMSISGGENIKEFQDTGDSGAAVYRRFCKECGSPLFTTVEGAPDLLFIKAGTLNDRSWLQPTVHYWCDTKQPWVHLEAGAEQVGRNPTSRVNTLEDRVCC